MNLPSYRPLIGINLGNKPALHGVPEFHFVSSDYTDAIVQAGGIPVLLPPVDKHDYDLIPSMLAPLDGLLFTGGPDLDPDTDGFKRHHSVDEMPKRRELFDRALIAEAAKRRLPVMGIGVGMQLLNVSQGGLLFLHIPEDLPRALPHYNSQCNFSLRHRVIIEKGTLLYSVYGDNEVRVNSRHHMAVDDVAPGFIVSARCPGLSNGKNSDLNNSDSVIEAIESTFEDWFAFGVQFHPEMKDSATHLDRQIFVEFINGVIAYKKTGRNVLAVKPHVKETAKKIRKPRGVKTSVKRDSLL
ncbi:MAG: gamma-glutamyl-gamma-aminobutyrate hydrolase family protein [Thermoguttaceae bacterium]|jgi:putative glutamine amidotransferase